MSLIGLRGLGLLQHALCVPNPDFKKVELVICIVIRQFSHIECVGLCLYFVE